MRIQLQSLSKSYPTPAEPLVVLAGITLDIPAETTLAILGPSGSGKSTLLNILGTLDAASSGEILYEVAGAANVIKQSDLAKRPSDVAHFRAAHLGFVFQDHHLLPQLTALENVLLPCLAQGRAAQAETERAGHLLDRVGLGARKTHLPSQLSGGERQRVAIARALINKPSLLLADEPTGNLDPHTAEAIMQLLIEIARETKATLLAVTHNPTLAQRFSRTLTMRDGVLV